MKQKRVSSEEVAKKAGVSRTTVSFVLNNTPGKQISEKTRQRVLHAASSLNYVPNSEARNLAMIRHQSIGLFISHTHSVFSDAFIIRLIEGMVQVLNKNRFRLVLQPLKQAHTDYLELSRKDNIDGIVFLNTHDHDAGLAEFIESGFPLVVIGSLSNKDICQIDIDNYSAAREVVNYLVAQEHKEIAMIVHAPLVYYAAFDRLRGYREALKEAAIDYRKELVKIADYSEESGYQAMQELLSLPRLPSAVFAGNDIIAYGAIKAIRDSGLNIPDDISIAGFDDDFLSRYLNPPLTTMSLPAAGLGAEAARLLINQLQNKQVQKPCQIILPTHFSIRDTCKRAGTGRDKIG